MKWRRTLVWLLAIGAAVLSFDALRAYALGGPALEGGVIPERTVLDREWLAALWALEIDAMAAAGILGIGMNRRDWRAWAMFLLAAVASLGFQVVTPPVELARAVPPVALFLAIVILELRTGGAVAAEESTTREGSTPRPPGRDAGRVAVAGNLDAQETGRLGPGHPARGSATPPHSPVPTPVADSRDAEGVSLPDQPRPVTSVATPTTDRDQTVARPHWATLDYLATQVIYGRRRSAAAGATTLDLTVEQWIAVLEQYRYCCGYCDTDEATLEMDHRTPFTRGGQHTQDNVIPACRSCNAAKGARTEEEYRADPVSISAVFQHARRGEPSPIPLPTPRPACEFTPAEEAVLYRQRANPEGFAAKVAAKGFDPEAAMEMARRRRWPVAKSFPVANGHKEATPA